MREAPYSIDAHLQEPPPNVLYHYTSMEAAISIVKNKSIWAADIFYLNDSSEYHKVLQAIRRRLDHRITTTRDANERANLQTYKIVVERGNSGPAYVSSFSSVRDDLSQWRGYTPQGLGVCLGFRGEAIKQIVSAIFGARMGRVIYINEQDDASFDPILDAVAALRPGNRVRLPGQIQAGLDAVRAAPLYKDDAFEAEGEWRICLGGNMDVREDQKIEFRAGRSTIVPYKVIELPSSNQGLFNEVIIGPSPNVGLSVEGFQRFLLFEGVEGVPVVATKIPYRPW